MYAFLRKQLTVFLVGFVVAFVVYLFVRFDADKVLLGVVISAVVGIAFNFGIVMLERQFPDKGDGSPPANH